MLDESIKVVPAPAPRTLVGVVGLGASAGGLDALVRFFSEAPAASGLAFVVVQHLSLEHRSLMPELLARHTSMPMVRAYDGVTLEPDTVYLMPPQQDMMLVGNQLRMHVRQPAGGVHHPINFFFASLAEVLAARAVGVVLSGTGTDGTLGARAIHAAGGLTIAQEPSTAGFDGMPLSVTSAGVARQVLAPEQMGAAIVAFLSKETGAVAEKGRVDGADGADGVDEEGEAKWAEQKAAVRRFITLLSRYARIDFGLYRQETLLRRARRRAEQVGAIDLPTYIELLEEQPAELERLIQDVLIGVSSFFRDAATFELLGSEVLPAIVQAAGPSGEVRGWCPACSTGQEAYSLAMLASEVAERVGVPLKLKLFATDVSAQAIERAVRGAYPESLAEQLSPERLERFFRPVHGGFRVERELRQMLVFSVHNALRDPPFSRLDFVSCRNMLIYLQPQAQRDLLARFAMALRPGGVLVLGASEALGDVAEAFEVVDVRAKIYRRKAASYSPMRLVSGPLPRGAEPRPSPSEPPEQRRLLDEMYRTLARLDSPLSLLVNSQGNLVHAVGDTHEFFTLPAGQVTLEVARLARGTLGTLLSAALTKARRERQVIEYRGVFVRLDSEEARLDLRVAPLLERAGSPHYLVSVRHAETSAFQARSEGHEGDSVEASGDEQLEVLRHELGAMRENLQAAIEELETSNEEMQATNEELVSANEELQATNEELQATNEELFSANAESERRIQDLVELNADVDGLMRSTQIGTLFVDERLAVRKFTPAVCEYVSLLDRDVGRPIAHVRHSLGGVDLSEFAAGVLTTGVRADLPATSGVRHLLLKAVPYRLREATRGVVISFVDVTELAAARAQLEGVMDSLPEQVAVLDRAGQIVRVNRAWHEFGAQNGLTSEGAGVGASYLEVTEHSTGVADALPVAEGLRSVLSGVRDRFSYEYRCDAPQEERHFFMHVKALGAGGGAVVSHVDVSPVVRAARELQQSVALYQRLFAVSNEALLLVAPSTGKIVEANPAASELLGRAPERLVATELRRVLTPQGAEWETLLAEVLRTGSVEGVVTIFGHGPAERQVRVTLLAVEARGGRLVLVRTHEPLTERLLDERAALRSRLTQAQKMEALGLLAGGVAHELNNVLTSILAIAYARRDGLPADDPLAQDLDSVLSACGRGADLTRNLLGFARSGSVARECFRLADVAREVGALVGKSVPPRIVVSLHLDEMAFVTGDRSQVAQALMNLCLNAIDAVRGEGHVDIEVGVGLFAAGGGVASEHAFVRVKDDGVGMDEATQEHAFDPFFTTKPRGEGTGLGLSMVYGVGKSHGGWVEIASAPGAGAAVTIVLPRARGDAAQKASRPPPPRGARERLLIVDDDELVRRSMKRLLERQGYVAETSASGDLAIARLRSSEDAPINLVLLDILMPQIDGLATLELIRGTHPKLPVLLYSGYPDRAPNRLLELDRYTGFCVKPIDPGRLTETVNALLAGQRLASTV